MNPLLIGPEVDSVMAISTNGGKLKSPTNKIIFKNLTPVKITLSTEKEKAQVKHSISFASMHIKGYLRLDRIF